MIVTCPRCPKTWTGTTASHCPACHETFSVDSNGERHRKGAGKDRHCVDPSTVGLVLNRRGCWAMPAPDEPIEFLVSRTATTCALCSRPLQDSDECDASGLCLMCLHGPVDNLTPAASDNAATREPASAESAPDSGSSRTRPVTS